MSQTPQKLGQKMCKSPKNSSYPPVKTEKIDYENLNTNCTVVGSNNLNLVKKPQIVTSMSPAYSNPSPGYPPSPYSSPASLKSPSPSLKPPTPQPNFPVMQIIHNSHSLLARPIQSQPQNIIKLKPHLNILPKPSASPQPSPKPSVSPQIVIPTNQQATATIMPTAQPMLLNQMPLLTPQVQFILRPQTKLPTQMSAAATPQGLILQPSGQPLLQIQPPRSQPMVRVLTNGVQLAPSTTTTYVTHMTNPIPVNANIAQNLVNNVQHQQQHQQIVKKKPKNKVKKKLDLANIMKLSGIGDEDDIQFESDASQSESEPNSVPNTPQPQHNLMQTEPKKISNIQLSTMQPTPVVQVLNQNFQSGMISNNTSQAQTSIPFNPFITPIINNGLMMQRSGGFKLTVGEDGRLVLQHDPTLNQDLQSQLILQSIFGINGGLVLQPSMDQQTVQQTVQTIQQQSVQTIQQQTVQSQTIQTVQQQTVQPQTVQSLQALQPQIQQQTVQQTIQHQTVQSQPLMQQPMQIVQPQPIHSIQSQVQPNVHSIQSHVHSLQSQIQGQLHSLLHQNQAVQTHLPQQSPVHSFQPTQQNQPVLKVQPFQKSQPPVQTVHPQPIQTIHHQPTQQNDNQNPPPTSYVVNLTPEQLEQLKRNGQVTVNGQTIFMQRPNSVNKQPEPVGECKKLSPKIKPVKKVHKIQSVKSFLNEEPVKNLNNEIKENKSSLVTALQTPPKHTVAPQNHQKPSQPSAIVQPSVQQQKEPIKSPITPPKPPNKPTDSNGTNQDVEKLLGQLLEESSGSLNIITSNPPNIQPKNSQQRIHTIQLTPQKQEHLKNIQMQIQTLSASLTPGNAEIQAALKMLFAEQQKILVSGKLLSPDKVYYHNNHLTIINPSSLNAQAQVKTEPNVTAVQANNSVRSTGVDTTAPTHQVLTTQAHAVPRISVSIPSSEHTVQQTVPHSHTSSQMVGPRLSVPPIQQLQQQQKPQQPQPTQVQQTQQQQQQQQQQQIHSVAKKAHLIETQLNLDQTGALKPDIHTPFRDKKDACIRLIRYHCLDQPVLSQKDLHKADEIFEMTAKHFIGKYAKMVDKYKYLLMKESMRQVQTSELMMLDRMYLSEERQSLMRLRQEVDEASQLFEMQSQMSSDQSHPPPRTPGPSGDVTPEDYDEWACIQRELGCLPPSDDQQMRHPSGVGPSHPHNSVNAHASMQPPKRTASSDSRLETLKRFRVDKHNKKMTDCVHNNSVNSNVQSVNSSGMHNTHVAHQQSNVARNSIGHGNHYHHHHHHHHHHNNQLFQNDQGNGNNEDYVGQNEDNEPENNSIDEQVQSAIDSILNLQQNTALDLDSILS